jgi:hypothetical protein
MGLMVLLIWLENVNGVRRKLSERTNKEVLYIHSRAHILSLAAASCRNKNQKVKWVFHVVKDIYKLFSMSPKKENISHEIQVMIGDPVLKIPECIEVRWLSHHRILNAVYRSLKSILMACEHIYKDGENLASLAGRILLEIRNESFIVTCHVMNELLGALSFLINALQRKDLSLKNHPSNYLNKTALKLQSSVKKLIVTYKRMFEAK